MLLIKQEFQKNDPASLLRQASITLKQYKPHPATRTPFLQEIYLEEIFGNGGW